MIKHTNVEESIVVLSGVVSNSSFLNSNFLNFR